MLRNDTQIDKEPRVRGRIGHESSLPIYSHVRCVPTKVPVEYPFVALWTGIEIPQEILDIKVLNIHQSYFPFPILKLFPTFLFKNSPYRMGS